VAVVTMYGSWVVQAERLETVRAQVESIKQDYQRRDVLAEQLRNINDRLYSIEQKLGERSPLVR
jgi:Tfp pilus assembly protein PilO